MSETIFSKIIRREIPAQIVFETEQVLAFRDINPVAPVHILVIPKRPIPSLAEMSAEDAPLVGEVLWVVSQVAAQEGLADGGYRVVTNIGRDGGQTVAHLHFHLIGARHCTWPPG
jgi:histidine triad (HIT) family protein